MSCFSTAGFPNGLNMTFKCASRPCFPGVQCIDLRPPYTGYVCGRCPPGYHGNGRTCTKQSKHISKYFLKHCCQFFKSMESPEWVTGLNFFSWIVIYIAPLINTKLNNITFSKLLHHHEVLNCILALFKNSSVTVFLFNPFLILLVSSPKSTELQ